MTIKFSFDNYFSFSGVARYPSSMGYCAEPIECGTGAAFAPCVPAPTPLKVVESIPCPPPVMTVCMPHEPLPRPPQPVCPVLPKPVQQPCMPVRKPMVCLPPPPIVHVPFQPPTPCQVYMQPYCREPDCCCCVDPCAQNVPCGPCYGGNICNS